MLGTILIMMGVALAAGSIVAGYYFISLACTTNSASGCQASAIDLISELMISNEGIFFWAAWVVGLFLVWGGMHLRARSGR